MHRFGNWMLSREVIMKRMVRELSSLEQLEFDLLVDEIDDPNLLGFLRRIPESAHYRRPSVGSNSDIPSSMEIRTRYELAKRKRRIR